MAETRYFHGGAKGLPIGAFILPPSETNKRSTSDYVPNRVHRRDRVYVATDINGAGLYAAVHAEPIVYEVRPLGDLEPDPDCDLPGLSFACGRAMVVAIHKLPGKFIKKARKVLLAESRT